MEKNVVRAVLILLLVLLNVGCDQVSKSMVRNKLDYHERIELVGDYFIMTKVENEGAFLSLGSNLSPKMRSIFLTIIPTLGILLAFVYVMLQKDLTLLFLLGFCCIIGGGVGNLWDRILYESVTDFFNMGIGSIRTGIFNMADVSIMFGMGLVITDQIKRSIADKKKADSDRQETMQI